MPSLPSHLSISLANSDEQLQQILDLQALNHRSHVSEQQGSEQGFVTVQHQLPLLQQMNAAAPQVIALHQHKVVGYALVMPASFRHQIPVLQPMFDMIDHLLWHGTPMAQHPYYVMGQICVAEHYRSMGVFDALYHAHRQHYAAQYDWCITEVSTSNQRSMKAHQRVGFRTIHTYTDHTDEWNIVAWDWS